MTLRKVLTVLLQIYVKIVAISQALEKCYFFSIKMDSGVNRNGRGGRVGLLYFICVSKIELLIIRFFRRQSIFISHNVCVCDAPYRKVTFASSQYEQTNITMIVDILSSFLSFIVLSLLFFCIPQ